MAEQMVAKYLAKHCPTTHQLAAFVASRSQELLLKDGRMLACVLDIHKSKVDVGSSAAGQDRVPRWMEWVKPFTQEQLDVTWLPSQYTGAANPPTGMTHDGATAKEVNGETKTEVVNLKSELQKMEMKMELMLQRMKAKLMVEVKDEVMEMKSAVNAEMMVLKAEVAKSCPTIALPECPICLQDMAPPIRIIQCKMGHKLCESCYDAVMKSGRRNCPGHCGTGFIGRDLGMEAFLRQLTGKQ